ncbi:MAG: hypothetical protein RJQ08_02590 [Salinisphaeraceae bacterium]|uniref:Uncharacterized protein n=2 Tax=Spectribacter TaxID=3160928 RepID=A0ABU3C2G9_9GAMM|nr:MULTISPECIES: hypothetical protein [unclassified Salinisphaera]MDT0618395.1 hypothetical protein [Salinisphaera sp. P385]MDT0635753.1 hypothetical protein [Salinisphaera sp. W335]
MDTPNDQPGFALYSVITALAGYDDAIIFAKKSKAFVVVLIYVAAKPTLADNVTGDVGGHCRNAGQYRHATPPLLPFLRRWDRPQRVAFRMGRKEMCAACPTEHAASRKMALSNDAGRCHR